MLPPENTGLRWEFNCLQSLVRYHDTEKLDNLFIGKFDKLLMNKTKALFDQVFYKLSFDLFAIFYVFCFGP